MLVEEDVGILTAELAFALFWSLFPQDKNHFSAPHTPDKISTDRSGTSAHPIGNYSRTLSAWLDDPTKVMNGD